MTDEAPILGDKRREVIPDGDLESATVQDIDPNTGKPYVRELSLKDIKGARHRRGYQEFQPGFRAPGEGGGGESSSAPPKPRGTGAGPT